MSEEVRTSIEIAAPAGTVWATSSWTTRVSATGSAHTSSSSGTRARCGNDPFRSERMAPGDFQLEVVSQVIGALVILRGPEL